VSSCVVTGGAGFIGSHLVERLLNDGQEVVVLDNLSTGRPGNLDQVIDNPLLTVHQVDITNQDDVRWVCSGVKWMFHLAALADSVPLIKDPLKYHRANVDGTVAVLSWGFMLGTLLILKQECSVRYGVYV